MESVFGLEATEQPFPDTVLSIGNYDGVHLGHQKILSAVVKRFYRNAHRSGIRLPLLEAFRRMGSLSMWVEGPEK